MRRIREGDVRLTVVGFLGVASFCLTGCGGNGPGPVAPTAVSSVTPAAPTPGPAVSFTISVTDGWTGTTVAGAKVSAEGIDAVTDAAGRVQLTTRTVGCVPVNIVASGFLQRRTCAASTITLWPVADEVEATATRSAAFLGGNRLLSVYTADLRYAPEVGQRPDVVGVWDGAVDQIKLLTSGKLSIPAQTPGSDEGYIVSLAGSPPTCGHAWFTWSFRIAGFCWDVTKDYFVQSITVSPELIDRSDVALRALLYAYALRPHLLPGLMNINQPGTELSTFERKTLHMMSLRWPTPVDWPDLDHVP